DRRRGPAALAFILARELGHIGLEHCCRGWQRLAVEEELRQEVKGHKAGWVRDVLQTGIVASGKLVHFLYSRDQEYEADLFALHLCRNAGLKPDEGLDGLRLLARLRHPDALTDPRFDAAKVKPDTTLGYYFSAAPDPLVRLRRLLMECRGEVDRPAE